MPMRGSRKFCQTGVQLNFDGFFGGRGGVDKGRED